jgi:hypothetical protein
MPSSLEQQCSQLGYSKKLSNNVLLELDQRAATKNPRQSPFGKSVLSPRGSRFNTSHRSRFSKMESISSHYAAIRTKGREEIELEKENIPSYDPNSKRCGASSLENVAKRRRTAMGRQEVVPTLISSKRMNNLQEGLQKSVTDRGVNETVSRIPKATVSTMRNSTSSRTLNISSEAQSRTISINMSPPTKSKQLPRSATLHSLTKPTASSLQRSTSNRNLGQVIRSTPSMNNLSIPRMQSSMNLKQQAKPAWR